MLVKRLAKFPRYNIAQHGDQTQYAYFLIHQFQTCDTVRLNHFNCDMHARPAVNGLVCQPVSMLSGNRQNGHRYKIHSSHIKMIGQVWT